MYNFNLTNTQFHNLHSCLLKFHYSCLIKMIFPFFCRSLEENEDFDFHHFIQHFNYFYFFYVLRKRNIYLGELVDLCSLHLILTILRNNLCCPWTLFMLLSTCRVYLSGRMNFCFFLCWCFYTFKTNLLSLSNQVCLCLVKYRQFSCTLLSHK